MFNATIDIFGNFTAEVSTTELKELGLVFPRDGKLYRIRTASRLKSGFIQITARETDEDAPSVESEYPSFTKFSPRGKTFEHLGRIESRKGKRKLKAADPKPYVPLKGDTDTGIGERRKRYIR